MPPSSLQRSIIVALATILLAPSTTAALQMRPDSLREMVREFVELEERFVRIQDAALDSFPSLREQQEEVAATVERVMEEVDPGVLEARDRLDELPIHLSEARHVRNVAEVRRLVIESEEIRERVEVAQALALASDEVFDATQAYRAELLRRMREIDPEVLSVMARIHDLREEIRTATGGGGPRPRGALEPSG